MMLGPLLGSTALYRADGSWKTSSELSSEEQVQVYVAQMEARGAAGIQRSVALGDVNLNCNVYTYICIYIYTCMYIYKYI